MNVKNLLSVFHNIILGDHASWNNVIFVVLNIFSFVFFQKGFFYFFVDTKLVCIHVYHIQREREREREREIGMIILLYDLSNTTCDFFIVINIFGDVHSGCCINNTTEMLNHIIHHCLKKHVTSQSPENERWWIMKGFVCT